MKTIKELIPESEIFIILVINIEEVKKYKPMLTDLEVKKHLMSEFNNGIYYEGCYELINLNK